MHCKVIERVNRLRVVQGFDSRYQENDLELYSSSLCLDKINCWSSRNLLPGRVGCRCDVGQNGCMGRAVYKIKQLLGLLWSFLFLHRCLEEVSVNLVFVVLGF